MQGIHGGAFVAESQVQGRLGHGWFPFQGSLFQELGTLRGHLWDRGCLFPYVAHDCLSDFKDCLCPLLSELWWPLPVRVGLAPGSEHNEAQ